MFSIYLQQGRPEQVRGPIGNTFAGPYWVVCAEIFEGKHQVTMTETGDVKERGPNVRRRAWEVWGSPHFHLSSRNVNGQRRNTQILHSTLPLWPASLAIEEVLTSVSQDMGLERIFFQREGSNGFF